MVAVELLQHFYKILEIQRSANIGDLVGIISATSLLGVGAYEIVRFQFQNISAKEKEEKKEEKNSLEHPPESSPKESSSEKILWSDRLKRGLSRSHSQVWSKMGNFFRGRGLTSDQLEEVEELLYGSDIGPTLAGELTEILVERAKEENFGEREFKNFLFEFLEEKLRPVQEKVDQDLYQFDPTRSQKKGPLVIMIVGVNGAGKTTTIGKLATKLTSQGAKVVVGACDTFRAAAVDQLQVWCHRAGALMVRAKEGAGPSGVGYEALEKAINEKADYCILDTAGRLHTKANLMDELTKSKNVLKKLDPSAPHHTLLVIDAITGQNAIAQAKQFHQSLKLNGLIFTKCDGSSKAGSALSIIQSLEVPITYIGVGEGVEDLDIFKRDEYLKALLNLD